LMDASRMVGSVLGGSGGAAPWGLGRGVSGHLGGFDGGWGLPSALTQGVLVCPPARPDIYVSGATAPDTPA